MDLRIAPPYQQAHRLGRGLVTNAIALIRGCLDLAQKIVHAPLAIDDRERRMRSHRERRPILGRDLTHRLGVQRFGIRGMKDLDKRPLQPCQIADEWPSGVHRMEAYVLGQMAAGIGYRRFDRRVVDQVAGYQVVEVVVTEYCERRREVLFQAIKDAIEVGVGVNFEAFGCRETIVTFDQIFQVSAAFQILQITRHAFFGRGFRGQANGHAFRCRYQPVESPLKLLEVRVCEISTHRHIIGESLGCAQEIRVGLEEFVMGMMIDGKWHRDDLRSAGANFVRPQTVFRNWVTADGSPGPTGDGGFKAERGRYHLYVSLACPWAHRTLIVRSLKKLNDAITVSVVDPFMGDDGWAFRAPDGSLTPGSTRDDLNSAHNLHEIYTLARRDYTGRVTVPVLWDRETKTIVNNESSEIIRMFNSAFNAVGAEGHDLYPKEQRAEIDELNAVIYENINNGVYKCGFAKTQEAYEAAFDPLFETLDSSNCGWRIGVTCSARDPRRPTGGYFPRWCVSTPFTIGLQMQLASHH